MNKQISIEDLIQKFLNLELGSTPDEALNKLRVDLILWSDSRNIKQVEENERLKEKINFIVNQCLDLREVIRLEKKEQRRLLKIIKNKDA